MVFDKTPAEMSTQNISTAFEDLVHGDSGYLLGMHSVIDIL